MMQGWQCPKCKRINAPWVGTCPCYYENQKVTCSTISTQPYRGYMGDTTPIQTGPTTVSCAGDCKKEEDK